MGKVWTFTEVAELVNRGTPRELAELLICLYNRQTRDEQSSQYTTHLNSRGFNAYDAKFLSSVAEGSIRHGRSLTPGQCPPVRKALHKYTRQILHALNSGEVTLYPYRTERPPQNQSQHHAGPIRTASKPPTMSEAEWKALLSIADKTPS
jgi:hypothetical protein